MSLTPLAYHHEYLEPSRSWMPLPFVKSHRYWPYHFARSLQSFAFITKSDAFISHEE